MILKKKSKNHVYGLYYNKGFLNSKDVEEILAYLKTIYPIWENRYSENNPPPPGETQRQLLRPVYWLGNWQFACLDYYRPPHGVDARCVRAEPFPPIFNNLVQKIESVVHRIFNPKDIPSGWNLNTCLINLYGDYLDKDKRVDRARVGEHKDFEPGPVASISLGERALFQFVASKAVGSRESVEVQQWLDHGSLQIFGGTRWKKNLFHRVQRVDRKEKRTFDLKVKNFETRRINFTFRYVPERHIIPFSDLAEKQKNDIRSYVEELAKHSSFFQKALKT